MPVQARLRKVVGASVVRGGGGRGFGGGAPAAFDPSLLPGFAGAYLAKEVSGSSAPEHFGGAAGTLSGSDALDPTALGGLPGITNLDGPITLPISFAGSQAMTFYLLFFDRTKTAAYIWAYGSGAQAMLDLFLSNNHTFSRANNVGTPITSISQEVNRGTIYPTVLCYRSDSARVGENDQYPVADYGHTPPATYSGPIDNNDPFGSGPLVIADTASSGVFGGCVAFSGVVHDDTTAARVSQWLMTQAGFPAITTVEPMGDSISGLTWRDDLQGLFDARPDGGRQYRAVGVFGTPPSCCWSVSGSTTVALATDFDYYGMGSTYFTNVVILNIGINDILSDHVDAPTLATRMGTFLDDVAARNPGCKFLWMALMPVTGGYSGSNSTVVDFVDNHFDGVVTAAQGRGITIVGSRAWRTLALAGTITTSDGLHPDAGSQAVMASSIYADVCALMGVAQ